MIRRVAVLTAAGLLLTAPGVLPGSPAAANPAAARSAAGLDAPVNLLGNPAFAAEDSAPNGWTCDDGATGRGLDPGSEFMQMQPLDAAEAPNLPLPGRPPAISLASPSRVARASSIGSAPATSAAEDSESPGMSDTWLQGRPTATSEAGCSQEVPARRGTRYTLTVWVEGGEVFLGSEYGGVSATPGESLTKLTTTFTTARNADTVRIRIHGRISGRPYLAMAAALVGPPSRTRIPVAPLGITVDRQTSHALRLHWLAAAGASQYEVRRDGKRVRVVTGTSILLTGLAPGRQYVLTVVALNCAGRSTASAPFLTRIITAHVDPPDPPVLEEVTTWMDNGTGSALLDFGTWGRASDGYFVYLDGVRVGWLYGPPGRVPNLAVGPHTLQLSGINSAGESALSEPYDVLIGR